MSRITDTEITEALEAHGGTATRVEHVDVDHAVVIVDNRYVATVKRIKRRAVLYGIDHGKPVTATFKRVVRELREEVGQ